MKMKDKIKELLEPIQMVAKISGLSTDAAILQRIGAHEEFKFNLKKIDIEYTPAMDNMLNYFRDQYKTRPHVYVGDKEFYSILWRCLMKGLPLDDALNESKNIIDRETMMLDAHYRIATPYNVNFY